jgi:hypothetical protein
LEAEDVVGGCFQEAEVGGGFHKVGDGWRHGEDAVGGGGQVVEEAGGGVGWKNRFWKGGGGGLEGEVGVGVGVGGFQFRGAGGEDGVEFREVGGSEDDDGTGFCGDGAVAVVAAADARTIAAVALTAPLQAEPSMVEA